MQRLNIIFILFFVCVCVWGGGGGGGRSPTYNNLEHIYVKILLVNIKILPFHWMSNLHILTTSTSLFIFSDVRYDMSNKQ